MAESNESGPIARATKPVSEALLNEKVCAGLDSWMKEAPLYNLSYGRHLKLL